MEQRKKAVFIKKEKVLRGESQDKEVLQSHDIKRSAALTERSFMDNAKKRNTVTFIEME